MFIRVYVNGDLIQEQTVVKTRILIGRHETCDIRIPLAEISSEHLNIILSEDKTYVMDKKSLNGSYLDNKKMKPMEEYEFIKGTPIHLAKKVAIEILPSEDEASDARISPFVESKTSVTSTEKLGLDFTSIRIALQKELKPKLKPLRREKVPAKKVEENSYLMPIIAVVIIGSILMVYLKR